MPATPSGPFPSRDSGEAAGRRHPWLTPGVAGVGAASMFSDAGHEMTTAMLPAFLTSTLHASAGALGVIEGIADALTGVMKLVGGPLANDPAHRGRVAAGGYLGTALATGAIGLAVAGSTPLAVAVSFALAGLGIGFAETAQSALVARLLPDRLRGSGFGVLGAVQAGGTLLASSIAGVLYAAISPVVAFCCVAGWMVLSLVATTLVPSEQGAS